MRRDQLILLLQPYKNGLMPKKDLADSINRFAKLLLDLGGRYPRLRFNVALPGYILECIDPLIASSLREMVKRGGLEWLCMGYTEPFLSFSPLRLTSENIALGTKVFEELTGEAPTGFVPPFSNWEPSHIDVCNAAGLKYAVISSVLLAKNEAESSGYWITEYTGSSMAVFPARSYHLYDAPQSITGWIRDNFAESTDNTPRMAILKYLYPLEPKSSGGVGGDDRQGKRRQGKNHPNKDNLVGATVPGRPPLAESGGDNQCQNPQEWIERIAAEVEKHILEIQPLRFKDVFGNTPPLGLHYFPSSLVPSNNEPATPYFLNHLHCYDQIGVMQRKLMDVSDSVCELTGEAGGHAAPGARSGTRKLSTEMSGAGAQGGHVTPAVRRLAAALNRELFFAQDINRFLPAERAGFGIVSDRLWTYGKLIGVERELYDLKDAQNCVIRLADFLRNGYKSVIMSNRALKLYIDHKSGAQLYALDYRERAYNACAAYNPMVRSRPNVIVPRDSRLGFRDCIFTEPLTCDGYIKGKVKDCANFADSPFEYVFKNSPAGIKVLLNCNGGFADGGRNYPLTMDKVFGLEKDSAALSFSYKLGNTSLTDYSLIMGIELPLALPGCARGGARVAGGKKKIIITDKEPVVIEDITEWEIEDDEAGVRMEFVTQKKANVWLFLSETSQANNQNSNGVTMLMSFPLEIEQSSTASFTGRMSFRKIRAKGAGGDSL